MRAVNELLTGLTVVVYFAGLFFTYVGVGLLAGAANPPGPIRSNLLFALAVIFWPVFWMFGFLCAIWELLALLVKRRKNGQ